MLVADRTHTAKAGQYAKWEANAFGTIITIYLARNNNRTSDYPATQFTVVSQLPDSIKLNKESCLTLRTNNGSRLLIQTV